MERECKCFNCKKPFKLGRKPHTIQISRLCPFCKDLIGIHLPGGGVEFVTLPQGEPKEIDRRHVC